MITPEEGSTLTRIAAAGYRVDEISLSIWEEWSVSASHPELGAVTTHGGSRPQALEALLTVVLGGAHESIM